MNSKIRVLFLCTGNCFRSQLAEAILRHRGGDRFEAFSAGSQPAGFVHPLAVETLESLGVPLGEARSKSWDEFATQPLDLVITLCDSAARETCPVWPGGPMTVHWPLPDPAALRAGDAEALRFSLKIARRLEKKIEQLVKMDWPETVALQRRRLERIARL